MLILIGIATFIVALLYFVYREQVAKASTPQDASRPTTMEASASPNKTRLEKFWPKAKTFGGKLFWVAAVLGIVYAVVFVGNDGVGVLLKRRHPELSASTTSVSTTLECNESDAGPLPVGKVAIYVVPAKCEGTQWILIPEGPPFKTSPSGRIFVRKTYGALNDDGRPKEEERIEDSPYRNTSSRRRSTGMSFANPDDKPITVVISPR